MINNSNFENKNTLNELIFITSTIYSSEEYLQFKVNLIYHTSLKCYKIHTKSK